MCENTLEKFNKFGDFVEHLVQVMENQMVHQERIISVENKKSSQLEKLETTSNTTVETILSGISTKTYPTTKRKCNSDESDSSHSASKNNKKIKILGLKKYYSVVKKGGNAKRESTKHTEVKPESMFRNGSASEDKENRYYILLFKYSSIKHLSQY